MMYTLKDYLKLLSGVIFHTSREKFYPSVYAMRMAKAAMLVLWNYSGIYLRGKYYDTNEIRRVILEEIVPDDVETALSYFMHRCNDGSPYTLAFLIFHEILFKDEVFGAMADADFAPKKNVRTFEIPLSAVTVEIRFAS